MTMQHDCRGLELTTESRTAAGAFDDAVHHFLEYRADTAAMIDRALVADPAFLMPRILRAGAMLLMGTNSVRPAIDAELAAIGALGRGAQAQPERREATQRSEAIGVARQVMALVEDDHAVAVAAAARFRARKSAQRQDEEHAGG